MPKIIAAGVGLPLIGTGATVTTSQPLLNLTQTWNNVATAFTGLKFNVTDTASASGSLLMDLQVGGVSQFNISKIGSAVAAGNITAGGFAARIGTTGVIAASSVPIGFSSTTSTTGTLDVLLNRDAANTLALRNGTAAQAFNVYNTYTDASNYERLDISWVGNFAYLRTASAGTGVARGLAFGTSGSAPLYFQTGGLSRFEISTSGHFLASTDNTYDIGASGANRPRVGYFGTRIQTPTWNLNGGGNITSFSDGVIDLTNNASTQSVRFTVGAANLLTLNGGLTIASNLSLSAGNQILFGANARIVDSASGNLLVSTSGTGTGFGLLQFGGTTSSFPALKRSGAQLELRLADDTGFAPLKASVIKTDAVTVATLPSAASAGEGGRSFVTDALGPTFGAAVVGGGAVKVPVYSDSVTWLVG